MEHPGLSDSRRSAHGIARLLIVAVTIVAVMVVWLAIIGAESAAWGGHYLVAFWTLLAALAWGWMAAGLIHNGRKMRRVALGTAILNTVMPLAGLALDIPSDQWNPWLDGGVKYLYVPTFLAIITIVYIWYSSPTRLARHNG